MCASDEMFNKLQSEFLQSTARVSTISSCALREMQALLFLMRLRPGSGKQNERIEKLSMA